MYTYYTRRIQISSMYHVTYQRVGKLLTDKRKIYAITDFVDRLFTTVYENRFVKLVKILDIKETLTFKIKRKV